MATWDITALGGSLTEFLSGTFNYTSNIIALDSTHYMFAYQHGGTTGYIQILEVLADGTITPTSQTQFTTDTSTRQYLYKISATKVLVIYNGFNGDGFAKVITINPADWTITPGTALEFDLVLFNEGSIQQIDATHFLVCWSGGTTGHLRARVLEVNAGTDEVTAAGDEFVVNAAASYSGQTVKMDETHVIVIYTASSTGYVQTLEVNTSTWAITEVGTPASIASLSSTTGRISMNQLDGTHMLVLYNTGGSTHGAIVVEVNTTTWDTSLPGSAYASANFSLGERGNASTLDETHVLGTYKDMNSDGHLVIYEVDNTTWTISEVGVDLEFDTADADYISTKKLEGTDDKVLVVWKGVDADGHSRVFSVEVPVIAGPETPPEIDRWFSRSGYVGQGTKRVKLGKHYVTVPKSLRRK